MMACLPFGGEALRGLPGVQLDQAEGQNFQYFPADCSEQPAFPGGAA
jgi:hypothetical protein